MTFAIYRRVLAVLKQKPLALWGVSLMCLLLCVLSVALFGAVPGVAAALVILLMTSMTMIFLGGYNGSVPNTLQLFDCFRDLATVKRVLGGMGWMYLWILVWSLIPFASIVFGVIRAYEYRLTPYILMMEPDIKITDAIKESSRRTKGWKGKMFCADILVAAGALLVILILALLAQIRYIGVLFGLVLFLFCLCCVAFLPLFLGLVQAAFYEEIKNPTYVPPVRKQENFYAPVNNVPPQDYVPVPGNFCPRCGSPLSPNSNFCTNCGQKLN